MWGPYILIPAITNTICSARLPISTGDKNPIAIPANLISDDEDDEENDIQPQIGPPPIAIPKGNHQPQGTPLQQTPEDKESELQGATPHELHLSPEPKGITTSKFPAIIEDDDTSVVVDEEDCQESIPEVESKKWPIKAYSLSD